MVKKLNKKNIFEIVIIILITIFCISLTPKTLQNDTFYTIKIGEYILQTGKVDMLEHFAWHSNLEYTYPHWLYDVIIYLIYSFGEMIGIYISTCLFAIILGISIYKVNSKIAKNQVISFIITLIAMYMLRDYIAARAQLVTFILFVLQIFCIEKLLDTSKKRYAISLIIISILIANLHVAVWPFMFILYLPYIAEYIMAIFEEKVAKKYGKEVKQGEKVLIIKRNGVKLLIITMIICIFTGLLTPLGTTPYTYLLKTMQGNTTQSINEHQPLVLKNNSDMICVLAVFLAILAFTKFKIKVSDLIMLLGLIVLMFFSKRQATILILIGSIILNKLIFELINKSTKDIDEKVISKVVNKFGIFVISAGILMLSLYFIKPKVKTPYIDENMYPVKMSNFIIEYFNNDFSDVRIYNEYNYGSYLLYRGIPVFIDSRADLYAPEFNEGSNIFSDFIESSSLSVYFEDIFKKYDITHVILYKDSKINMIIEKTNLEKYKLLKEDEKFVFYEIEK